MEKKSLSINEEDILALDKIIELVRDFSEKNPIKKVKFNFNKIKDKISKLKHEENGKKYNIFKKIIKRIELIIWKEIFPKVYYIVGGHGGVIIDNTGFCEFDSPEFALKRLIERMNLAIETKMPYNIEVAICCIEWLKNQYHKGIVEFLDLFKKGRFEVINPSYSQPYNLIIGEESNIKQFEYGLKVLNELGLDCKIYYCSEVSLHPQIPQILKGFNIEFCSLRTRLLGTCPTSNSGKISWVGLDNSTITTITDQSGVFNGEFWHGTFFKEIPDLLFQAVSRPFMKHLIFSSIEDFINPLPFQEEIWRISTFSEIFGKFVSCSELFEIIKTDGEFKYGRDEFSLGEYIFIQSELFLNNKKCEVALISAEIVNCILGRLNGEPNDSLLDQLWKRFLLTQAHDNYAVPYTRPGDYSAQQLSKIEYEKLKITAEKIAISDLSIKIQKEIIKSCENFISESLKKFINFLIENSKSKKENVLDLFVLNPTIYTRQDIVSIPLQLENASKRVLVDEKGEFLDFIYQDSIIKFIPNMPSMGYKIYSLIEQGQQVFNSDHNFLYDIVILEDNQTIEVRFKNCEVYRLKLGSSYDYTLSLIDQIQNEIENKFVIQGEIRNKNFSIEITQYNGVNRLEFVLNSELLKEIIVIPSFKILKSLINYPFGIEETKRSNIQTLDFLWLVGEDKSILYIQKNSQQFIINRRDFEIQNLIKKKGIYEFSISILHDLNFHSAYQQLNAYKFKLLGSKIHGNHDYVKKSDSMLSINPELTLINLWTRDKNSFLRILNPSNEQKKVKILGSLIKDSLEEIDFNNNPIKKLKKKKLVIEAWKILNLKI